MTPPRIVTTTAAFPGVLLSVSPSSLFSISHDSDIPTFKVYFAGFGIDS